MLKLVFQNFPQTQLPDIFGMHDNVDIARELQETKQLFDSVLLTQGGSSGGVDASAEEKLLETARSVYDKVNTLDLIIFWDLLCPPCLLCPSYKLRAVV